MSLKSIPGVHLCLNMLALLCWLMAPMSPAKFLILSPGSATCCCLQLTDKAVFQQLSKPLFSGLAPWLCVTDIYIYIFHFPCSNWIICSSRQSPSLLKQGALSCVQSCEFRSVAWIERVNSGLSQIIFLFVLWISYNCYTLHVNKTEPWSYIQRSQDMRPGF